jgi:prophage tail gpP-like protein
LSISFKNEVAVVIGGKRFRYWSRTQISRAIDSIDTVQLEGPFEPGNETFRQIFRPMSYQSLNVTVNDEPLLTGTMVPVTPRLTPEANDLAVGAYSLPGVLSESTPAVDALPLLFKGQNLHEIAATLLEPFGLQIEARVPPGDPFKKVRIRAEQKILPALADLAKQRNQVISNNPTGDLVFQAAIESGEPVATLQQGLPPLVGGTPSFNAREYYSEITGLKSVRPRSKRTTKFTAVNTLIPNIHRPFIFKVPNTKDVDLEDAVLAKKARMFANAIAYNLQVATWRDASDNLWEPNTIVRVLAPGLMIYRPFDFVIRSVILDKDKEKETATLDVMVPGSFARTAEIGGLPWDE